MVSRLPHTRHLARFARLIVITGLLSFGRGGLAPAALAEVARPLAGGAQLHVLTNSDEIEARYWPLGNTVDLTIERAGTPASPDFSASQIVAPAPWDPSENAAIFGLNGVFHYIVGDVVVAGDGTQTRTLTVMLVTVTGFDPGAETISGMADPGAQVGIAVYDAGSPYRLVTADASGHWAADFSVPWASYGPYDLKPGTQGDARRVDPDGDLVRWFWQIPSPYIEANPDENWVHARGWLSGTVVQMLLDDPANGPGLERMAMGVMGPAPWNPGDPNDIVVDFALSGFDLMAGHLITIAGAGMTKTLEVTSFFDVFFDVPLDVIGGRGTPAATTQVCADVPAGCVSRWVTGDGAGRWTADYAVGGIPPDGPETVNLRPGSTGWMAEFDADNDQTWRGWKIPNPYIEANPDDNWIHAREWVSGTVVRMELNDPANGPGLERVVTGTMGPAPWNPGDPNDIVADFDLTGLDLMAGHLITISGAGMTKNLEVSSFFDVFFDIPLDVIGGRGTPGATTQVCANVPAGCVSRWVTGDGAGHWIANYGVPGIPPDGPETVNLQMGSDGWMAEYDADNDQTWRNWRVPNPHFQAKMSSNEVHAYEWPLGVTVTMWIDDPGTPNPIDDLEEQVVIVAPWNPAETFAQMRPWMRNFSLAPGMTVTVSGAGYTKTHVITHLAVTQVDPMLDRVLGTANPGAVVDVGHVCDMSGCAIRRPTADGSGNWLADFAAPGGPSPDEQRTFNLVPGSSSEAREYDPDGDATARDWRVIAPYIEANPDDDWVHGRDWLSGTLLTLAIDQAATGPGVDFTTTAMMGHAPWNPGDPNDMGADFNLSGRDLQPGDILTATGGGYTKTLRVSSFFDIFLDVSLDIISGGGTPGARTQVCANVPGNCVTRWVTGDGSGRWVANYGVPGVPPDDPATVDLQMGSNGWMSEYDADNDQTWRSWRALTPRFQAKMSSNEVHAYEWPVGVTVTMVIDDPGTPNPVDDLEEQVVIVAPWNPAETFAQMRPWQRGFALAPDMTVTVSGAGYTKTHVITHLAVTQVDPMLDRVLGTANPGAVIDVGHVCDMSGCAIRRPTADGSGNWLADFAALGGPSPDEQRIFNLVPGSSSEAREYDPDGDATARDWRASTAQLTIAPTSTLVAVGEVFTLDLVLNDVENLYGYQFQAAYDAGRLSASGSFFDAFFDTSTDASIPPAWNAVCAAGTCRYAVSKRAPAAAVRGSGLLGRIGFTALAPGTVTIVYDGPVLSDPSAFPILVGTQAADITIYGMATISGAVRLQGRATPVQDGIVRLTDLSGTFPPQTGSFDGATGAYALRVPALAGGTTWRISVDHALYLSIQSDPGTDLVVSPGVDQGLAVQTLRAGDANDDEIVSIADLTCIGAAFGGPPMPCGAAGNSDLNWSGGVDLYDLVLAGGNFGRSSPLIWP